MTVEEVEWGSHESDQVLSIKWCILILIFFYIVFTYLIFIFILDYFMNLLT